MTDSIRKLVVLVFVGCVVLLAGVQAAQRDWVLSGKSGRRVSSGASARAVVVRRPQANIGANANGMYCTSPAENGVGIHDLGALPTGVHVTVTVQGLVPDEFNPAAAVIVATVGERAANAAKVTTFYDNDSGGDGDSKIDFTTPQEGNYLLFVGDYTDAVTGCYRYQMIVS